MMLITKDDYGTMIAQRNPGDRAVQRFKTCEQASPDDTWKDTARGWLGWLRCHHSIQFGICCYLHRGDWLSSQSNKGDM